MSEENMNANINTEEDTLGADAENSAEETIETVNVSEEASENASAEVSENTSEEISGETGEEEAENPDGDMDDNVKKPVSAGKKYTFVYIAIIAVLVVVIVIVGVILVKNLFFDGDDKGKASEGQTVLSDSGAEDASSVNAGTAANVIQEIPEFDVTTTLGEYKNLSTEVHIVVITDDMVNMQLDSIVNQSGSYNEVNRAAKNGDSVNIDFVGYMDGEAFDGGTANGVDLILGSNSYIDGFESGLVGAVKGEKVTLNLAFPDPYYNDTTKSGMPVVFEVTVNSVNEYSIPELNDEFIAANTEYSTVEEIRKALMDSMTADAKTSATVQAQDNLLFQIIEASSFEGQLEEEIDYYFGIYQNYYTMMASVYGLDFESFLAYAFGASDLESGLAALRADITNSVKLQHVLDEIAKKENITVTEEEYGEEFTRVFTEQYGFETKEAAMEEYTEEEIDKMINSSICHTKAEQLIYDSATITMN